MTNYEYVGDTCDFLHNHDVQRIQQTVERLRAKKAWKETSGPLALLVRNIFRPYNGKGNLD